MSKTPLSDYLKALSKQLVLPPEEKDKIDTSINSISTKLSAFFSGEGVKKLKTFGSFDRDTFLSRKVDVGSDVDGLIIFDEKKWEAQTYFNKLKRFAEETYQKSEVYQDYPTIVIELYHIKFELTPCVYRSESFLYTERYQIPQKDGNEVEWIKTEPFSLKDKIENFDTGKTDLRNLILIFKYWNVCNGKLYQSFHVEKFILKHYDEDESIEYNFFRIIDKLDQDNPKETQNELNKRTQDHKAKIELLLENDMEDYAIMELKKILPEIQ